jgi:hypothetical protein
MWQCRTSGSQQQQTGNLSLELFMLLVLQADALGAGIPSKLISLLQQQDKSVKLAACRQLAAYAASAGLLQQAVTSMEALQVNPCGDGAQYITIVQ